MAHDRVLWGAPVACLQVRHAKDGAKEGLQVTEGRRVGADDGQHTHNASQQPHLPRVARQRLHCTWRGGQPRRRHAWSSHCIGVWSVKQPTELRAGQELQQSLAQAHARADVEVGAVVAQQCRQRLQQRRLKRQGKLGKQPKHHQPNVAGGADAALVLNVESGHTDTQRGSSKCVSAHSG